MASNKFLNNPWSRMLLTCNIQSILFCLFVIQLQLSRVNCSTQVSTSNQPHEVRHFILVHGRGLGAWSWYKLIPLLEEAGHNVTAIDLSASGINTREIEDLRSFYDYSFPLLELMDSLPPGEKVTLVGHSFGGMSLALGMDMYPNKISLAIFVASFLPDIAHRPSYVVEVDVELAKLLVRPSSLFLKDLSVWNNFTKEGFGSIRKAYIKSPQDRSIPGEIQRWMIENAGLKEVREIENADHMVMISRPQELSKLLLEDY